MSDFLFAIPGLMSLTTPISDSLPTVLILEPHTAGRIWIGISSIGPVTVNGVTPEVSADSAVLRIYESESAKETVVELTSEAGGVVIEQPSTWYFSVPPVDLPLAAGIYWWEFLVTPVGDVETVFYTGQLVVRHGHE